MCRRAGRAARSNCLLDRASRRYTGGIGTAAGDLQRPGLQRGPTGIRPSAFGWSPLVRPDQHEKAGWSCRAIISSSGFARTSTAPSRRGELDEASDEDLPSALDALAREWLAQHPGAPVAHHTQCSHGSGKRSRDSFPPAPKGDEDIAESREAEADNLDSLRWALGTHPEQPLICRVARYAGWGHPLPQPLFGGQVVSETPVRGPGSDRTTAEAALELHSGRRRQFLGGDWLNPQLGYCAESGSHEIATNHHWNLIRSD